MMMPHGKLGLVTSPSKLNQQQQQQQQSQNGQQNHQQQENNHNANHQKDPLTPRTAENVMASPGGHQEMIHRSKSVSSPSPSPSPSTSTHRKQLHSQSQQQQQSAASHLRKNPAKDDKVTVEEKDDDHNGGGGDKGDEAKIGRGFTAIEDPNYSTSTAPPQTEAQGQGQVQGHAQVQRKAEAKGDALFHGKATAFYFQKNTQEWIEVTTSKFGFHWDDAEKMILVSKAKETNDSSSNGSRNIGGGGMVDTEEKHHVGDSYGEEDVGLGHPVSNENINHMNQSTSRTIPNKPDIFHLIDIAVPIQSSTAANQSWVFRAQRKDTRARDVLCLQFHDQNSAIRFVKKYEKHRKSCLKKVMQEKRQENNNSNGNSNGNGTEQLRMSMNSMNISESERSAGTSNPSSDTQSEDTQRMTPPRKTSSSTSTSTSTSTANGSLATPEQTRLMRRRLTVKGETPTIDGYSPGAAAEALGKPSPVKLSGSGKLSGGDSLCFSGISRKGYAPYNPDKQNQDAMILEQLPRNDHCDGEMLFAVFDGHGENGHHISAHFKRRIPEILSKCPKFRSLDTVGESLKLALWEAEKEIISDPAIDTTLSGTTAVLCVVRDDTMIVANVGDSRIMKGMQTSKSGSISKESTGSKDSSSVRQSASSAASLFARTLLGGSRRNSGSSSVSSKTSKKSSNHNSSVGTGSGPSDDASESSALSEIVAVEISEDHKPDTPRELTRIQETGGRVFKMQYDDGIDGPARVWLSYADMPGLAMSRSLCDTIGKEAGVSSEAEIFTVNISKSDKFFVLATDGLWEFMSNEEVSKIVEKHNGDGSTNKPQMPDPRNALKDLVKESTRRWRNEEPVVDDTTIIVVYFT